MAGGKSALGPAGGPEGIRGALLCFGCSGEEKPLISHKRTQRSQRRKERSSWFAVCLHRGSSGYSCQNWRGAQLGTATGPLLRLASPRDVLINSSLPINS